MTGGPKLLLDEANMNNLALGRINLKDEALSIRATMAPCPRWPAAARPELGTPVGVLKTGGAVPSELAVVGPALPVGQWENGDMADVAEYNVCQSMGGLGVGYRMHGHVNSR